jgi:hypothetical protein
MDLTFLWRRRRARRELGVHRRRRRRPCLDLRGTWVVTTLYHVTFSERPNSRAFIAGSTSHQYRPLQRGLCTETLCRYCLPSAQGRPVRFPLLRDCRNHTQSHRAKQFHAAFRFRKMPRPIPCRSAFFSKSRMLTNSTSARLELNVNSQMSSSPYLFVALMNCSNRVTSL